MADQVAATITSNRIEWNTKGGIWLGPGPEHWPRFVQISNCYFDANFGPGMMFVGPESRPDCLGHRKYHSR